eukprot:1967834-Pleurochrysis_carterae.AAC.1
MLPEACARLQKRLKWIRAANAVLYAGTSMIQLIAAALGTSGYSASLDQQVVLALAVYISEAARLLISACL